MTIILQGFNWISHKNNNHYRHLTKNIKNMKKMNINKIWLPPPSNSKDPEGYFPQDYYNFSSEYGSKNELTYFINQAKSNNIDSIADIVSWYSFQGFCREYYTFSKRNRTIDDPMLHNEFLNYTRYLHESLGYNGFRFDCLKDNVPTEISKYIINSGYFNSCFMIGELWTAMDYNITHLNYNQNNHRQQIINQIDNTQNTLHMFDFTTKGILQEAITKKEYFRLADSDNNPPGCAGWWSQKSVTFLDNHDTLGQHHWPFSHNNNDIIEGYVYIFSHPGHVCVYYDHFFDYFETLCILAQIRNQIKPSSIQIINNNSNYTALINNSYYVIIGDPNTDIILGDLIFEYANARIFKTPC